MTQEQNSLSNYELKAVINDVIKHNYAVFLAFDVVDGKMTPKEYFDEV